MTLNLPRTSLIAVMFFSLAAVPTIISVASAQSGARRSQSQAYQPTQQRGSSTRQQGSSTSTRQQGSSTRQQAGSSTRQAGSSTRQSQEVMAKKKMVDTSEFGYEGYCPVCIVKVKKWVKGSEEFQSTYDDTVYLFPDADTKAVFDADPAPYIPALGGDCTVCLAKMGKRVSGNVRFASLHNNRVYLFPEKSQKQMFDASPDEFAHVDLAADGNCVVCAMKMDKEVAGKSEFTAVHGGMRYLFPSDSERQMFLQTPAQFTKKMDKMAMSPAKLGLSGYCPVCILAVNKWVKGTDEHSVTYDGYRYLFPDADTKAKFNANPAAYVPALGGDCTVCKVKMDKRVAGKVNHASIYQNRLFLFPGADEKAMFDASPAEFANVDLAANGNCVVCSMKMNKDVPGSTDFTTVYGGMRYQFPSDAERQMFLSSPMDFTKASNRTTTGKSQGSSTKKTSMVKPAANSYVSVTGKTGCAGCTYGVKPIGAPDELGLAVVNGEGQVYVIEESHTRWPDLYEHRFDGQQVKVAGEVLKTEGNIIWLQPTELSVL